MKNHWHEEIQRWMSGQSTAEEAAALHDALHADAELRALYLDYVNLDAALGAVASATALAARRPDTTASLPQPFIRVSPRTWRRLAATAACVALVVAAMLFRHRHASRTQPDITAVTASTRVAIARLHADVPPILPTWMSPTASLLEQPGLPN